MKVAYQTTVHDRYLDYQVRKVVKTIEETKVVTSTRSVVSFEEIPPNA